MSGSSYGLTVSPQQSIQYPSHSGSKMGNPSAPTPGHELTAVSANLEMLVDPQYWDLKITNSVHQREWKVHKSVVCARCPFFAACIRHTFKESDSSAIDLPEDEPYNIEYVLRYLYTYDMEIALSAWPKEELDKLAPFEHRFSLFAIADKLELTKLREYWQVRLINDTKTLTVFDVMVPTHKVLPGEGKEKANIERLVDFTQRCYRCENIGVEEIRNALVVLLAKFSWRCTDGVSLLGHILRSTIIEKPQLALDLIPLMAQQKDNKPVLELLKYQAMSDMLSKDSKIMLDLINSLSTEIGNAPGRGIVWSPAVKVPNTPTTRAWSPTFFSPPQRP